MTCECGTSLYSSWIAGDGTECKSLNLRYCQPALIGQEFIVRGKCGCCGKVHTIRRPEECLKELQGVIRIPIYAEKKETVAIRVKIRR